VMGMELITCALIAGWQERPVRGDDFRVSE
jgi:hypothetical protein